MVPYSMGRKPSNTYYDLSIDNAGNKLRMFHVIVPFPCRVSLTPRPATESAIITDNMSVIDLCPLPYFEKEQITKVYEEHGEKVLKIEPNSFPITSLCPDCKKLGVPSIIQKSNISYYLKSGHTLGDSKNTGENITKTKGKSPFWLTYKHGKKRCWVQQWQHNKQGTFKPNKKKKVDWRLYLMSQAIKEFKKTAK